VVDTKIERFLAMSHLWAGEARMPSALKRPVLTAQLCMPAQNRRKSSLNKRGI